MDPPTKPSVIAQIWNQQRPLEVSYINEEKFFADIDTMQSARAFAESLPMDFDLLRTIFLTAPDDLSSLINTPPDFDLLDRLFGIVDRWEMIHLVLAWLDKPTHVYVKQYLRKRESMRLTLPHPATLYECLKETLGESEMYQRLAVKEAVSRLPHDPIVRGVEFALEVRKILSSGECVGRFPTLVNIQKMNLVGFTFLVVLLLIMAQRSEEKTHDPRECQECREYHSGGGECGIGWVEMMLRTSVNGSSFMGW